MNTFTQFPISSVNVKNDSVESSGSCCPLYIGSTPASTYKALITFRLDDLCNCKVPITYVTLLLYYKGIISGTSPDSVYLNATAVGLETQLQVNDTVTNREILRTTNINAYVSFDLTSLVAKVISNGRSSITLLLFADPDITSLYSFHSLCNENPPFLVITTSFIMPFGSGQTGMTGGITGPTGPTGARGPTGSSGFEGERASWSARSHGSNWTNRAICHRCCIK